MEVQCKCVLPPGATAPLAWLLFCLTSFHSDGGEMSERAQQMSERAQRERGQLLG